MTTTRPSIGAVLFDFGNTLFGHDSLAVTIERLATDLGTPVASAQAAAIADEIDAAAHTAAELAHPRDLDADVWRDRWTLLYGLADRDVPRLGAALLADMHDPARWVPFAAAATVLHTLDAAGIAIGVVSNTGWDVRRAFAHHGLDHAVAAFTLSYEVGFTKPDVRMFEVACRSLPADAAHTLMVGDDPRADSGAVVAGMRTLLLPPTPVGTDNGLGTVLTMLGLPG